MGRKNGSIIGKLNVGAGVTYNSSGIWGLNNVQEFNNDSNPLQSAIKLRVMCQAGGGGGGGSRTNEIRGGGGGGGVLSVAGVGPSNACKTPPASMRRRPVNRDKPGATSNASLSTWWKHLARRFSRYRANIAAGIATTRPARVVTSAV